jgi:pimeloyl-ACP methyl ester carboxylesterase
VDGVRSPVLTVGPDDATDAVVFVHGNPGPGLEWIDLLERVGGFARAIAPDMPGFGQADKPRKFDYSLAGYGQHLSGLLEALGIRRAHLVLHDFGGGWGLEWAINNPETFASAILFNTGVLQNGRWHRWARIWRTPVLGELFQLTATRGTTRMIVSRENPRLTPEQVNERYERMRPWAIRRTMLRVYRATPFSALGYRTALGGSRSSRSDSLRRLDRPALVIWGSDDAYVSENQLPNQRKAFPSAQVEVLEGHGHWPFLEDPERAASLVIPFLHQQLQRTDDRVIAQR